MRKSKILCAIAAAAFAVTFAQTSAFAETEGKTVFVSVEKFTVGQGFTLEPTAVTFSDGDSAADVVEKALGKENINNGEGVGTYISSIANDKTVFNIPKFISDAVINAGGVLTDTPAVAGQLSGMDFFNMSGWLFALNNESSTVGLSDYEVKDGDVIRLEFSIIGYGSDIGFDTSSMADWGGMASLIPTTDRDSIIKTIAENKDSSDLDEYTSAISVMSDLGSTQEQLDTAENNLINAVAAAETTTAATTTEETTAVSTTEATTENSAPVTSIEETAAETTVAETTALANDNATSNENTGAGGVMVAGVIGLGAILAIAATKKSK